VEDRETEQCSCCSQPADYLGPPGSTSTGRARSGRHLSVMAPPQFRRRHRLPAGALGPAGQGRRQACMRRAGCGQTALRTMGLAVRQGALCM
jgi:hypothetical protein